MEMEMEMEMELECLVKGKDEVQDMQKQQSKRADCLPWEEVLQVFDLDFNTWIGVDSQGQQVRVLGIDFENGLKQIHAFVDRARMSDSPAYRVTRPSGRLNAQRTRLGSIPTGAFVRPEFLQAYQVSEQVRVFLEAEEQLRIHQDRHMCKALCASWTQPGKLVAEVANDFVDLIRKKARHKNFRRRLAVRRFGSEENFRRGKALIDALFRRHARLNVVRIDLGYKREHRSTVEQAKTDFDRLLNNSRNNRIFHSLLGNIWHLEWGFESGWHWHVIFFLDGSKTRADAYVTQQIGDYWEALVTDGRGRFHNCNARKSGYRHLGIGLISHGDQDKRDVLVNKVLRYLTKVDELARPRVPKGMKTFGTSQFPQPHPGTGRRRSASPIGSTLSKRSSDDSRFGRP